MIQMSPFELLLKKIERNWYLYRMTNPTYHRSPLLDERNHVLEMSFSFLRLQWESRFFTDILQGGSDEFKLSWPQRHLSRFGKMRLFALNSLSTGFSVSGSDSMDALGICVKFNSTTKTVPFTKYSGLSKSLVYSSILF